MVLVARPPDDAHDAAVWMLAGPGAVPGTSPPNGGGVGAARGQAGDPGLEILLHLLLRLHGWANHHARPPEVYLGQNRGNKSFATLADPVERQ